jgi:hypothetical protein
MGSQEESLHHRARWKSFAFGRDSEPGLRPSDRVQGYVADGEWLKAAVCLTQERDLGQADARRQFPR